MATIDGAGTFADPERGRAVIRVVITGSECTGKTTLATAVAESFGTVPVDEYVRQFVREKGAAPAYPDVGAIARGQIELEDATARAASRLNGAAAIVIQDTDLVSTVIYSHHYYGRCPRWIEEALAQRLADLYLLADIDVPWVPDGDQRDRPERREEMQELFRRALGERGARVVEIRGSREERLETARAAIEELRSP